MDLPVLGGLSAAPRQAPAELAGPRRGLVGRHTRSGAAGRRLVHSLTSATGTPLPQRDLVLVLAAAAIVISLIVQGLTLEPLARLAGFGPASAAYPGHEETVARLRLAEAGLARLNELADSGAAPDAVIDRLRTGLQARIGTTRARMDQGPETEAAALTERELRGDLIAAENAELSRLFQAGTITAATRQRLQRTWTWRSPG